MGPGLKAWADIGSFGYRRKVRFADSTMTGPYRNPSAPMTLQRAIAELDTLDAGDDEDEYATLYMREPWTASSECIVLPSGSSPVGFRYFLEVFIVRELLEELEGTAIDPIARV